MLEGLERVAWGELGHAYGAADDVPGLLWGLAAADDDERQEARYALYGNIWHQGTVYEASAYAVPFLIELLTEPGVQGKDGILELLYALGNGHSYLEVHQHFDSYRSERDTEEFDAQRSQELQWVDDAHRAVADGVPVYCTLLAHPDEAVRVSAAFVLTACPERFGQSEPALRHRLGDETEPSAKASLLFALAQLARLTGSAQADATVIAIVQNPNEAPLVRFVGALGAIFLGGEAAFADVREVLRETAPACADTITDLPWQFGETPVAAVSAVVAAYPNACLTWLQEMRENPNPDFRVAAIDDLGELSRTYRFVAAQIVVPLAQLVGDRNATVRLRAARALPYLGQARFQAVPVLTALQAHADPDIARLATETLAKVEAPRDTYHLENWLKKPQTLQSVADYSAVLDSTAPPPTKGEAATALEFLGPPAQAAVPALRRALTDDAHWLRVRAARALWYITGDPTECLPILTEEIQCRPAGLLALDCLAALGSHATSVLPTLDAIVTSPQRLVDIGSEPDWIDADEAYHSAADHARARIRAASA